MLGGPGFTRKLHRLIDNNVPASRLLGGLIFSEPGNWTSWAPHEHTDTKEEIYLYIEMPPPAFGIQLGYENLNEPEYLGPGFEKDEIGIKRVYHSNADHPGHRLRFR